MAGKLVGEVGALRDCLRGEIVLVEVGATQICRGFGKEKARAIWQPVHVKHLCRTVNRYEFHPAIGTTLRRLVNAIITEQGSHVQDLVRKRRRWPSSHLTGLRIASTKEWLRNHARRRICRQLIHASASTKNVVELGAVSSPSRITRAELFRIIHALDKELPGCHGSTRLNIGEGGTPIKSCGTGDNDHILAYGAEIGNVGESDANSAARVDRDLLRLWRSGNIDEEDAQIGNLVGDINGDGAFGETWQGSNIRRIGQTAQATSIRLDRINIPIID